MYASSLKHINNIVRLPPFRVVIRWGCKKKGAREWNGSEKKKGKKKRKEGMHENTRPQLLLIIKLRIKAFWLKSLSCDY